MSTAASASVPPLLKRLLDDAAVFPPGNATLPQAVTGHREHRSAWYAALVGVLLLPASGLKEAAAQVRADERIEVGVIGDLPLSQLSTALSGGDPRISVQQVETAVAKRGEDPQPGLRALLSMLAEHDLMGYAEIPLTWGLLGALDTVAEARAAGQPVAAKFRTGGLAAELFPTPMELAAVICACRDRALPFKLTAGLHHAVRHTDPETGFVHHGFLNVLAGACAAAEGAEVADVAAVIGTTQPLTLMEAARTRRHAERPLWVGYGTCSIAEPLEDLIQLGLLGL
ncbi:hypothetical protein HDA40_004319 [Hamadaea flava]|uniref:Uncharacterized protein n=1 Tax=Hamadaea flava TaxID=1742688 RepID=A0ABV8LVN6_9ACTN|nr:hypothetical protein [Hamadaea flava]MCP2325812.1 hypothetical protein [Hamadaea flava]